MLDLVISTTLKFDLQIIDESRLLNKGGMTPHRRSTTIASFDYESMDRSALDRDKETDEASKIQNFLSVAPSPGVLSSPRNLPDGLRELTIPSTPDDVPSKPTPKSKAFSRARRTIESANMVIPHLASPNKESKPKVAFASASARKTSVIKASKANLIDYSLLELALQSLFSALHANFDNQKIFVALNGQNV